MRHFRNGLIALFATTSLASPAFAQPGPASDSVQGQAGPVQPEPQRAAGATADDEQEIVVEARRRRESVQDVPLALSAVSQARLDEAHVTNIADISQLVPSVSLSRNTSNPSSLFPFIRGFGTKSTDPAAEPPIALTIDGIYMGALIGAFVNLADVEAVEVARGPQGTLLGKNAPAGAVSIRTRRPGRTLGGRVDATYGSWQDFQLSGSVDIPLVADHLFSTISIFRERSDGYVRDIFTGEDVNGIAIDSVRVGLLADLGNLTWYVQGTYTHDGGENAGDRNISDFTPLRIPTATYCPFTQPNSGGFPGQTTCAINPATGVAFPGSAPPVTTTCVNAYSRDFCTTGRTINGQLIRVPNNQRYTTQSADLPNRDTWNVIVASNLEFDAGPVTIASVTGWREFRERVSTDIDGLPVPVIDSFYDGHYRQWSQELRLASSSGGGLDMGGRLNWLIGTYFFNFDYDRYNNQTTLGAPAFNFQQGITNSYALFAHAELEVVDNLTISGGVRQTWDRKTHSSCAARCLLGFTVAGNPALQFDPTFSQRENWDNLSYDATVQYDFTPDNMVFLRYATGYRGGGFIGVPANAAAVGIFDPETVKAWEFGTRNDFFGRRLRVNVNVFRSDFDDLQRTITEAIALPPFFLQITRNIAGARFQGVEVETVVRPFNGLTLRGNLGYLDAKYTSFTANLTGNLNNPTTDNTGLRIPYTSKWTIQLGATYVAHLGSAGSLTFSADWAYRSRFNTTDLNFAFAEQSGVGLLSGTITWRDQSERFSISVSGRNLTDRFYIDGGDAIGNLSTYVSDGPPRSFAVSAGVRF